MTTHHVLGGATAGNNIHVAGSNPGSGNTPVTGHLSPPCSPVVFNATKLREEEKKLQMVRGLSLTTK